MKKTWKILAAALVVGILALPAAAASGGKTHDLTVTVVSVDVEGQTITFKDDKGKEKTVPVLEQAVDDLKGTEAGEKVVLTCQDDASGKHEGVTAIAPARA